MPRERQELFRQSNNIEKEQNIVLAFEGNDTERIYFEDLRDSSLFNDKLIHMHFLSRSKADTNSAPNHVFKKLKKEAKDEYNFNKKDELWMIIDKDRWKNIPEIIQLCKKEKNMYVAVSNPCFEFWLLLHVINISDLDDEQKQKLLDNPRVTNKKRYADQMIDDVMSGGYKKTDPKPDRFFPTIKQAIEQAIQLDDQNIEFPDTSLGSHVYKVIQKIIK